MSKTFTPIRLLRVVARTVLVIVALFWFIFAVLSGAGQYGEGIGAVVRNLPNALPWLALFGLVVAAFRWEFVGGALVALAGLGSIVFFKAWQVPIVLLGVSFPLVVGGMALILCSYGDRVTRWRHGHPYRDNLKSGDHARTQDKPERDGGT